MVFCLYHSLIPDLKVLKTFPNSYHFGIVGHSIDPLLRSRLSMAMSHRHDVLASTAGLNEEVFDALVILAAGEWTPEAIADGYAKVQQLQGDMHSDRTARLVKLGFHADEASALSSLHTRNFM